MTRRLARSVVRPVAPHLAPHLALLVFTLTLAACRPVDCDPPMPSPAEQSTADMLELPAAWDAPDFPQDNAFTDGRWALGKALFFDPRLSRDGTISCATCHRPERAFTEPVPISPGVNGALGTRNTPTLANLAYAPYYMSEGGVPSLELQVFAPVESHVEMDDNLIAIAAELAAELPAELAEATPAASSTYDQLALAHYGRPLDPFVIIRAIATFERSLISGNAPFDQWQRGNLTDAEYGSSAAQGWQLFGSEELACIQCHAPPLFTTHGFANNGLESPSQDAGLFLATGVHADSGAFKIPTLRNIAVTAPYMHDGRFASLDAVLDHYESGGADHPHQALQVQGFTLDAGQRIALINFMTSLTDESFLQDPRWL